LRFIGDLEFHGLYTILASLKTEFLSNSVPIRFIVDTGALSSIIGYKDARKLGIKYDLLDKPNIKIMGVIGNVYAYKIPSCEIIFEDADNENKGYAITLSEVLVLPENDSRVRHTPSLLGIDILKKFNIRFNSLSVILEPNLLNQDT